MFRSRAKARDLLLNARSYKSVAAILKNSTNKTAPATQDAPMGLVKRCGAERA